MTGMKFALEQVRRLKVTNFFATVDKDGLGELAKMLSYAQTEIIAVAVIDHWLEEQTERPTPADLRRLVALHNEARGGDPEHEPVPVYKCADCEDTGTRGGDFGPEAKPYSLCDCAAARTVDAEELGRLNERWRRLRLLTERPATKRTGKLLNVAEVYRDV